MRESSIYQETCVSVPFSWNMYKKSVSILKDLNSLKNCLNFVKINQLGIFPSQLCWVSIINQKPA